jgi:hypothetical protein
MYSIKIISQNKYIKVIKVFAERYVNVKKSGQRIIFNGEHYYKLPTIGFQFNTIALL